MLFVGDMLVMAGMAALAAWLFTRTDGRDAADIPMHDEVQVEHKEHGEHDDV